MNIVDENNEAIDEYLEHPNKNRTIS